MCRALVPPEDGREVRDRTRRERAALHHRPRAGRMMHEVDACLDAGVKSSSTRNRSRASDRVDVPIDLRVKRREKECSRLFCSQHMCDNNVPKCLGRQRTRTVAISTLLHALFDLGSCHACPQMRAAPRRVILLLQDTIAKEEVQGSSTSGQWRNREENYLPKSELQKSASPAMPPPT